MLKHKFPNRNNFILQKDLSDCGIACLQNILQYYGLSASAEKLRDISGTSIEGTNMLGLSNAASFLGFNAQGAQAGNIDSLKEINYPSILYTIKENRHHYIVLYSWNGKKFIVGDPAKGILKLSPEELLQIWEKKFILLLEPTEETAIKSVPKKSGWEWVSSLIRGYANILIVVAVLGAISAILNLSTAIFSQKLLDKLLAGSDYKKIYFSIALLAIILFLKSGVNYIRGLIIAFQSKNFNSDLTMGFYERMLGLPKLFFDRRKTGDMVARLNDTNRIQQAASMFIGDLSIQLILLVVTLVIAASYSKVIGLVCLVFIPIMFLVIRRFQPSISLAQKELMSAYSLNESNYIDNIKGIGIIKLFDRQPYFFEQAKLLYNYYQLQLIKMGKLKISLHFMVETIASVFLIVLISLSVSAVLHKQLLAGEMIAILQFGMIIIQTTATISLSSIQLQEAKVALGRMSEFLQNEPEADKLESTNNHSCKKNFEFNQMEINNLSFHFPGQRALLKNISLTIAKGEIIAITGESGQGKSTLFQLLQRFYLFTGGTITVNGKDLNQINISDWRSALGVVTQEPIIFSGTVAENINMGKCSANEMQEVKNFCIQTGLDFYLSSLPHSYNTLVGEGGFSISGGQKQLICLARCLFHKPQIILLDEPTASLDKATESFVTKLLTKAKSQAAMIIISHKDSLSNIADSIYEMEAGILHNIKSTESKMASNKLEALIQ